MKTECDLCDDEGVCRPDRVVLTADETWVVDFKTGRDLGEEHDRQVRRYCRAMETMGYLRVSGWLIYPCASLPCRSDSRTREQAQIRKTAGRREETASKAQTFTPPETAHARGQARPFREESGTQSS